MPLKPILYPPPIPSWSSVSPKPTVEQLLEENERLLQELDAVRTFIRNGDWHIVAMLNPSVNKLAEALAECNRREADD